MTSNMYGGLQCVHPPNDADPDVVVLVRPLSMYSYRHHTLGQIHVVGHDRPAIAITPKRFSVEEAGRGHVGEAASGPVLVDPTKTLGEIL